MSRRIFSFGLLVSIFASCGSLQNEDGNDAGLRDSETRSVATDARASDTGVRPKDGGSNATYAGVVIAAVTERGAMLTYDAVADFGAPGAFGIGACAGASNESGDCCCVPSEGLPAGSPDAAIITIRSEGGASTLTTLSPSATAKYGLSDLGGATPPGDYSSVDSQSWNPGDVLSVSATGDEVHPFSGTLQTGVLLSGVTPAIGPGPVIVDRGKDLEVAWTPEGGGSHATVLLELDQAPLSCYCTALDSAAKVTMSSTLVALFETTVGGSIQLERLLTSKASCDNATIDLIGEVAQTADVTFQ
jgi:hypothetical protein